MDVTLNVVNLNTEIQKQMFAKIVKAYVQHVLVPLFVHHALLVTLYQEANVFQFVPHPNILFLPRILA